MLPAAMNPETRITSEPTDDDVRPSESSAPRSQPFRWLTHTVIAAYLLCLAHGVVCHALQFRANAHPLMYFTVWDMFCGWSGWSFRNHVIAEGESGQFYALTPTPWGEFHPYSDLGREHYDTFHSHARRIGANCLKQTQHEPIKCMYLIEETWSKKFNLPEPLWAQLHEDPPNRQHYFHVDAVFEPDGSLIRMNSTFHDQHRAAWLAASLQGQSRQKQASFLTAPTFSN